MYSVAVAPMAVAAALAYFATATFAGAICKDLVVGGILVIVWLNIRCASTFSSTCAFAAQRRSARI